MIPSPRQPGDLRVPGPWGVPAHGRPRRADQGIFTGVLTYGFVTYGFVAYDHVGFRHRSPDRPFFPPLFVVPLEFL
ncbi:hypothetical protein ACZ91_57345 [Streptomyces regensis]|nr:hypothetical protein ACZ91_57345 [Streptomyces regensis]KOG62029.1 hypothetical protein ADK77_29480 [Streptomyces antibioticus]